jgi:pilus assembly protein CpaE
MENPETIRVLIVDNNPETREKIRVLLKAEKSIDVVNVARTGKEAIDIASEIEPDVVVLDANLPDIDEIQVTESICRRVPFTQIVILAVQVDPNYMRRAMLAGARDFIVKPPLPDELRSAVYRAGGLAREKRESSLRAVPQVAQEAAQAAIKAALPKGKIVQVYSPKGGIGCSTIAVNLALALHSDDTKTAIVDGNLQYGDVAIYLNEVGFHNILDLVERVDDMDPDLIAEVMMTHPKSGLDIMVAPNRLELAEKVNGEELYKVLQYLRRIYTYIVVDTPTSLNDITLSIMDAADIIVMMTTQEIAAIKNARQFLSILDGLHFDRQKIIFVMNRYDKRVAISPERVSENLKQDIECVIPLDESIVNRSVNQGIPFTLQHKSAAVSRGVFDLAAKVKERLRKVESAETTPVKMARSSG